MNEQAARDVMLLRAVEMGDPSFLILKEDDRREASRLARQRTREQPPERESAAPGNRFLTERAGQILPTLTERYPAFASVRDTPHALAHLWLALPPAALLAGFVMHRISDPHRVDLLSAPLLLIIGWNLLVYAAMLVWPCLPRRTTYLSNTSWVNDIFARWLGHSRARLPAHSPRILTQAIASFWADWASASSAITAARIGRTLHLGAAFFALGAVLSLYVRGYFSQYVAGWESTFLSADDVHALLSVLFAPAERVFQLKGFSTAEIDMLRFDRAASPLGGARWVHLYAATLLLLVVLPRTMLAAVAHWRVRRLHENFALDLKAPYFQNLLQGWNGAPATLQVLPYSFTVDEQRQNGLRTLAGLLLGEQARVRVAPTVSYDAEPQAAAVTFATPQLDDTGTTLKAVLFNLAATPEKESHGMLLNHLVRTSPQGMAVLVDTSAYLERLGSQAGGATRMAERVALWRRFCSQHKTSATFVNLLKPDAQTWQGGLALSTAP